ncbi:MAG: hypothetical protein CSA96_02345 [Bacteroidetes bacterium]|nr:MAG: hypothetical protein CSA96_02345 [Bacteroidota bacterium]
MERLTDEEMIIGLRKRDGRVLEYIYENSFESVQQLVLYNSGSEDDAEDLFQDALVVIFKQLRADPDFELRSRFSTYIYSIARLIWMKRLKQIKKLDIDPLNRDLEESIEFEEPLPVQDKDLQFSIYQRVLKTIPEDCQDILRLTAKDVSAREIARKLGFRSEGYVRKRRHHCKKFLIGKIKEDPDYQALIGD